MLIKNPASIFSLALLMFIFFACATREKIVKSSSASYVAPGALIKNTFIPVDLTFEYDERGRMVKQINGTCTGKECIKIITVFDTLGREISLERYDNNTLTISQKNQYNEQGELISEYRIEKNEESIDTTHFEYFYNYVDAPAVTIGFRTNNGDTVTRYELLETKDRFYRKEEAYPAKGYIVVNSTESILNDAGKPVKTTTQNISSLYDAEKPDTSVSVIEVEYNDALQITKEVYFSDGKESKRIISEYQFGGIRKKIFTSPTHSYDVIFEQTFWP